MPRGQCKVFNLEEKWHVYSHLRNLDYYILMLLTTTYLLTLGSLNYCLCGRCGQLQFEVFPGIPDVQCCLKTTGQVAAFPPDCIGKWSSV